MLNKLFFLIVCQMIIQAPQIAWATSASQLIEDGNHAYQKGKYEKALEFYDEASVEAPESPYIYYNKGTVFYRQGDYAKAKESFEKAALKTKDLHLEAQSNFNMGNCAFREMERQMDSDLKKALESCQDSIRFYQEALELDPEMNEAGENIEIARLTAKNLLDQIKKQEEARQKQQQAQDKAKQQLEDLIERQQEALERNHTITKNDEQKDQTTPPSKDRGKDIADLTNDQDALQKDTSAFADNLLKTQQKQTPPAVNDHLSKAVSEQGGAVDQLKQKRLKPAQSNQEKAVKELKEALAALSEQQQQSQQQQQNQQQQQKQQSPDSKSEQKEKKAASPKKAPKEKDAKMDKDKQQTAAQLPDEADDIIKEEQENKKQRQRNTGAGYQAVEKDW